jgi:hypothetical protein
MTLSDEIAKKAQIEGKSFETDTLQFERHTWRTTASGIVITLHMWDLELEKYQYFNVDF